VLAEPDERVHSWFDHRVPPLRVRWTDLVEDEAVVLYFKDPQVARTPRPRTLRRAKINALAKALGDYLHSGRHVAPGGQQQGDFPVDHRDAAYVLGSTRLLIAYTSQIPTGIP